MVFYWSWIHCSLLVSLLILLTTTVECVAVRKHYLSNGFLRVSHLVFSNLILWVAVEIRRYGWKWSQDEWLFGERVSGTIDRLYYSLVIYENLSYQAKDFTFSLVKFHVLMNEIILMFFTPFWEVIVYGKMWILKISLM